MTKEEFKNCFDDWFEEIRNFINSRCCDAELATDIVQEAYTKLWEKKFDYQGDRTKGLLYKIASDLWVTQYRKSKSEQKHRLSLSIKEGINETEQDYNFKELKQHYEKALSVMPEKRRVVFLMSRMEDMTYTQIAERLELSVKAVEKRMKLALVELRNTLNHGKGQVR
ncbi:RNA polymerase sigma factor [Roseivirga misakiensis]|uniref:RNA polymerase sigma factor n=1 Tax=Roseivirga misakiensis TaxID=1563681 RepID=UPI00159F2E18|nr:sigma-70 family RNA polymerase sigma factor [Roseivirga misakiensis]